MNLLLATEIAGGVTRAVLLVLAFEGRGRGRQWALLFLSRAVALTPDVAYSTSSSSPMLLSLLVVYPSCSCCRWSWYIPRVAAVTGLVYISCSCRCSYVYLVSLFSYSFVYGLTRMTAVTAGGLKCWVGTKGWDEADLLRPTLRVADAGACAKASTGKSRNVCLPLGPPRHLR